MIVKVQYVCVIQLDTGLLLNIVLCPFVFIDHVWSYVEFGSILGYGRSLRFLVLEGSS